MSQDQDDARQALLEQAARGFQAVGVGDPLGYLSAYYRHVDLPDLNQAGPRHRPRNSRTGARRRALFTTRRHSAPAS